MNKFHIHFGDYYYEINAHHFERKEHGYEFFNFLDETNPKIKEFVAIVKNFDVIVKEKIQCETEPLH